MNSEDIWKSDSEDEVDTQNEIPPPPVDSQFKNNVLEVKHSLYDNIVLSPELGTRQAQSKTVLQEYLDKINKVYVLSLNAQSGQIDEAQLDKFPAASREQIKQLLLWIRDYFSKKNSVPDTIPYTDFIRNSFHEYQFVQNNSFE
jgi:hypothetical protein